MRVLLDAHMLGAHEGGNETYVAGLLKGFEELVPQSGDQIIAVHRSDYLPPAGTDPVRYRALKPGGNGRRLLVDLPQACNRENVDILHVTYNAPLVLPRTLVVTVHDVIYKLYPAYFSPSVRLLLNTLLPLSMRRAKVILTLSETSRHDIERFYPFTRGRVVVTPLAAGPVVDVTPDNEAALRYSQGRPYILAVGTVQPRKNIARLVEAYITMRNSGGAPARLVVVGRAAWQHSTVMEIAQSSRYGDDIVFTGYLPDATVAALYQSCAVFVYPSLYEGFGLPVLEAMACGAPVITSRHSSLPEVAGDAAVLVDPHNVAEIAATIKAVLSNPTHQAELRERGRRRAAQFSWRRTGQLTLDAYRQALL